MECEAGICHLSAEFYSAYPYNEYPEILTKGERPYTCLMIETHDGYFICILFRSSIQHNEAFIFKNTQRSARTRSGLDYKKTVIIEKSEYIDLSDSISIDNDEYSAMILNIEKIVSDIHKYISRYVDHINGTKVLHEREFRRSYQYSTLSYFHDILGL